MARVFGKLNGLASVDCENNEETLGLMEVNYRFDPNRIIKLELVATDCKGEKHIVEVHELDMELNEFID